MKGKPAPEVQAEIESALKGDADWRGGRIWSLVYFAGEDVAKVIRDAYASAIYTNGLGPGAFRSLRKFESEVVGFAADLLGLPSAVGNMTSGGTESILMAIKTARDFGSAEMGITEPEMVLPVTAHPAFYKAAEYLGVKVVLTPVTSAPNYPYGTIDPIEEIGAIAQERGVPCHVDACLGGYFLPFMERNGETVPPWDFRVPGVSSISADNHKYGYAARGASTVLYRDANYRRHQYFAYTDWPGGLYGSPTMTGSRPGGAIAAAWAVMTYLGEEGYRRLAATTMETARKIREGINEIDGLTVQGNPDMSVFSFTGDGIDINAVGDALDRQGWHPDRQHLPASLHVMVTPAHAEIAPAFLEALRSATEQVRSGEITASKRAAMYGSLDTMPDRGPVRDFIFGGLDRITAHEGLRQE
jgi:glutamate/tyrosine decarboxylase-like PLP-dependent enzyme